MTTIESIIKAKFLASDAQVEALANVVAEGQTATGTYLSVLIAHVKAKMRSRRKPTARAQEAAIDTVHERLYPRVLAGVGPADLDTAERNRRATFARSAASDLRHFARAGGNIAALNPAEASKTKLRAEGRSVPTGTRSERTLARSLDTFERTVQRMAKTSPDDARRQIEDAQARLEALLEALEGVEEKPAARRHRGARPPQPASQGTAARTRRPVTEQPRASA